MGNWDTRLRDADERWLTSIEAVYHDTLQPNGHHIIEQWANTRRWDADHLLDLGAVTAHRTTKPPNGGNWLRGTVIRIPCHDAGRMTTWQDRTPKAWQAAGVGKWLHPPTAAIQRHAEQPVTPPWPAVAGLDNNLDHTHNVYVVEGMTDYITGTWHAHDELAIVAALGAQTLPYLAHIIADRATAPITIWPHMDTAGITPAHELRRRLHAKGRDTRIELLDGYEDLTDMHEQLGGLGEAWETG